MIDREPDGEGGADPGLISPCFSPTAVPTTTTTPQLAGNRKRTVLCIELHRGRLLDGRPRLCTASTCLFFELEETEYTILLLDCECAQSQASKTSAAAGEHRGRFRDLRAAGCYIRRIAGLFLPYLLKLALPPWGKVSTNSTMVLLEKTGEGYLR